MNLIKTDTRSRLLGDSLDPLLRIKMSEFKQNTFDVNAATKKFQADGHALCDEALATKSRKRKPKDDQNGDENQRNKKKSTTNNRNTSQRSPARSRPNSRQGGRVQDGRRRN